MPGRKKRPAAGPARGDRGAATLETVIVFPVFMVLVWGLLQLGLWAHGRTVCQGAAEQAAAAGAAYGAGTAAAEQAGRDFAAAAGRGLIKNPSVRAAATAAEITVTVDADVLTLAPAFPSHISQTATLPIERRT